MTLANNGVGLRTLLVRLEMGKFVEILDPTIEDSYSKVMDIDGSQTHLKIFDPCGEDQFPPTRDLYIKDNQGFLLVYSIIDQKSFNDLIPLRDEIIRIKGTQSVPIVLVGNKCDLEEERVVSASDGQALATSWGCPFFETSAKTNQNVERIFIEIVREIDKTIPKRESSSQHCTLL